MTATSKDLNFRKVKEVMNKMVISLIIEGNKEDLHEIKGKIISTASEALVSVTTNEIKEANNDVEILRFLLKK